MLTKSEKHNPNYLAKIVELKTIRKHSNADRLQVATVDFQDVITGLDAKEGDVYVFFPLECQINYEFLKDTNSFSSALLNADTTIKGYFDKNGRVKAVRLRGEKSMGYIVPFKDIQEWAFKQGEEITSVEIGTEFDMIGDIQICQKYFVPVKTSGQANRLGKKPRISRLVEGQVHLHVDTEQLRKEIWKLQPEDEISISYKVHGTSFWVSNVLVKKKLSFVEKILRYCGVGIEDTEYDIVYGSRKVVKNEYETQGKQHYYGYDLWSEIAQELKEFLPKGYTIYGEALGFTKEGSPIQQNYDYGCVPPEKRLMIYRITYTNPDGLVFNLSAQEIISFCERAGLETVFYFFLGRAKEWMPELDTENHWHENLIKELEKEYNEKDCFMCKNKVPEEGIVLRIEKPWSFDSYKLKSFRYLEKETEFLDKGQVDMESAN